MQPNANTLEYVRGKLTLVKQQDDLVEALEEVHVIIAILLNLVEKRQLRTRNRREGVEEGDVALQMAKGLVLEKIFLLVPFHAAHDAVPDLNVGRYQRKESGKHCICKA